MTLLFAFMAVVFAAILFWWWQGVSSLNALERGNNGPFKVTRVSGSGDSYLAVDREANKIALVNVDVPSYNEKNEVTSYSKMTVVFAFSDVTGVMAVLNGEAMSLRFSFVKPVPAWNLCKELTYMSGEGIQTFFSKYLPEIKISYYKSNKYGGVERLS